MNQIFDFERDFGSTLRCIPMAVRCKLDTVGIKLKLDQWNNFTLEQKQNLLELDCNPNHPATIAEYKKHIEMLVLASTGNEAKSIPVPNPLSWFDIIAIPPTVKDQAHRHGVPLTLSQWQKLQPLQRFALIKLSQPGHENKNFMPACQEFGLIVNSGT